MINEIRCQNHADASVTASALLAALERAGHSNTRPRRAIIAALAEVHDAVSAASLLRRARAYHPQLAEVTVYRTLELLSGMGLVRRIHHEEGCHLYALSGKAHGHHLLCRECDQVVEFEGCDLGPLLERVTRETGFAIDDHWLELFGICPACQRTAEEPPAVSTGDH